MHLVAISSVLRVHFSIFAHRADAVQSLKDHFGAGPQAPPILGRSRGARHVSQ